MTALILAVSIVLTLHVLNTPSAGAIDLSQKCSLTVRPGSFEDLANANIKIDMYKIADAVEDSAHGSTYRYQTVQGIELDRDLGSYGTLAALTNEDWQLLSQQAAKSVLAGENVFTPAPDSTSLDCGLYLIVAYGSDVENYVLPGEDGRITTAAYSDLYAYTFLPELVSLPSTVAEITGQLDENGGRQQITTSGGNWQYSVTATLKPTQELRFGDLEIIKTLRVYEDSSPATFVFSVEANMRGEKVYSEVFSADFYEAGQRRIKLTGLIPVGAEVTVTEVYSGSSYSLTTARAQHTVIAPPDQPTASVSFVNTYNHSKKQGFGILNHFTYSGEKGWSNDNSHDSTVD